MKKFLKKNKMLRLGLLFYGLAFFLLLITHFGGFVYNRILYANGTLMRQELTVDDFLWEEIAESNGFLISYGSDPKMLLKDTALRADTVYIEVEYSQNPRVVSVFYADEGQGHSVRRMAYARPEGEGLRFWLPPGGTQNLRLDPTSLPYNEMRFSHIIINEPRPFYAFFVFSAQEWLLLAVLPGLALCAADVLRHARRFWQRRGKAGESV